MALICGKFKFNNFVSNRLPKRFRGHGAEHWSVLKKKVSAKDKALKHFDDLYKSIYGNMWKTIRSSMLKEDHKYVALVNNFASTDEIEEKLKLLGAMNLKELYKIHKQNKVERDERRKERGLPPIISPGEDSQVENKFASTLEQKSREEIQSFYPNDYEAPNEILSEQTTNIKKNQEEEEDEYAKFEIKPKTISVPLKSLDEDLKDAKIDSHRIIKPTIGLTSASLHEYIPATKIRGLDDYVLESEHYEYYTKGADYKVNVEEENHLNIPNHLKVYTFEDGNHSEFPQPRRTSLDVYDYYCMDGASILPVLALDLKYGDTMLDMCAAPGGKSLVALQTMLPKLLVANEVSMSRLKQLNNVMEQYLGDLDKWTGKLYLTNFDAREIEDKNLYNKILVDVPCTNDRLSLHEDDNNWFKSGRLKERLQLPEVQAQILLQALKLVVPGGTVVYSTCTLSPIQNEGIVQLALKRCWEETNHQMVVKDIDIGLAPLRFLYKFGKDFGFKYGHIVLPTRSCNWGPLYFCKIVREK